MGTCGCGDKPTGPDAANQANMSAPWKAEDLRKPTVDEVVALAAAYYALDDNVAGGSFHIVLDDGNIQDTDVAWCDGLAVGTQDYQARDLGAALARLSVEERAQVYNRYEEYAGGVRRTTGLEAAIERAYAAGTILSEAGSSDTMAELSVTGEAMCTVRLADLQTAVSVLEAINPFQHRESERWLDRLKDEL